MGMNTLTEKLENNMFRGGEFTITKSVISTSIPDNAQTYALTGAASEKLLIEEIIVNTDATGWANPTNIEFSVDNAKGVTGEDAPIALEVIASFGANLSFVAKKDATSHTLPLVLEKGKKIYIHGDDAAGTGTGVGEVTIVFKRLTKNSTIAAA